MDWQVQLKRIRRFLRDPSGAIWSDAFLLRLYNDEQRDLQRQTKYLKTIRAVRVPAFFKASYTFDWEWEYFGEGRLWQCFNQIHQGGVVCVHSWEAQHLGTNAGDVVSTGRYYTQPWEAWLSLSSVGTPPPFWFPDDFGECMAAWWDKLPVAYLPKSEIMRDGTSWLSRAGEPWAYYRDDTVSSLGYLFPVPSTVVFDDVETRKINGWLFTQDWEASEVVGDTAAFTKSYGGYGYVFDWEATTRGSGGLLEDPVPMYGMWEHEQGSEWFDSDYGIITGLDSETFTSDLGIVVDSTGDWFSDELGASVEHVYADDNLVFIYSVVPPDLSADNAGESAFPVFLRKYIEYGVIARAYNANTDGRIKSLAEYWEQKKEIGVRMIKKFMSNRNEGRVYRARLKSYGSVGVRRHPRLPDTYPATF